MTSVGIMFSNDEVRRKSDRTSMGELDGFSLLDTIAFNSSVSNKVWR